MNSTESAKRPSGKRLRKGSLLRSLSHRSVRYTSYIGDGDSKTFSSITASNPYGEDITVSKIECVGHVQKNGNLFTKLKQMSSKLSGEVDWGKNTRKNTLDQIIPQSAQYAYPYIIKLIHIYKKSSRKMLFKKLFLKKKKRRRKDIAFAGCEGPLLEKKPLSTNQANVLASCLVDLMPKASQSPPMSCRGRGSFEVSCIVGKHVGWFSSSDMKRRNAAKKASAERSETTSRQIPVSCSHRFSFEAKAGLALIKSSTTPLPEWNPEFSVNAQHKMLSLRNIDFSVTCSVLKKTAAYARCGGITKKPIRRTRFAVASSAGILESESLLGASF
ncbi:hypothetical protein TNCV_4179951 [Trichonephila clavipes]|nr:hypothetical protein TNCV_4179951 [Trichonephila clavipes]